MSDKKISQLAAATTPLAGTEELPIVQSGVTVKATAQDVADLAGAPYLVYTALLTQSGGDGPSEKLAGDDIFLGVTYYIYENDNNYDLTVYGAPNSNVGTYFVCNQNATLPGFWTNFQLNFNFGAPVVTVLENTIGDIWFTYLDVGQYVVNCDGLFTADKTTVSINTLPLGRGDGSVASIVYQGNSSLQIETGTLASIGIDGTLFNTPIEIRVYP